MVNLNKNLTLIPGPHKLITNEDPIESLTMSSDSKLISITRDNAITKIKKKGKFRLSAKSLFLTYSQCPLSLEEVFIQLKDNIFKKNIIEEYLLCLEKHKEKGYHIHIYISLCKKVDIKNPVKLNLNCNLTGKIYKGNYQSVKDKLNTLNYIIKDLNFNNLNNNNKCLISDNLISYLNEQMVFEKLPQTLIRLSREGRIDEAMVCLEKERPMFFITNHLKIEKSLRDLRMRALGFEAEYSFNSFILSDDLKAAFQQSLTHKKSLFIKGGAGIGKTELIKSYFAFHNLNPLKCCNYDALKDFKEGYHTCI